MKLTKKMTVALLLIIIIGTLSACGGLLGLLFPLTIQERLVAFAVTLNSDERNATEILLNFGSATTMEQYNNANVLSYWESAFPAENEYVFTVEDETDTDAVVVEGLTTLPSGGQLFPNYTFKMYEEESGNWLIDEIYEDGTMIFRKIDY